MITLNLVFAVQSSYEMWSIISNQPLCLCLSGSLSLDPNSEEKLPACDVPQLEACI